MTDTNDGIMDPRPGPTLDWEALARETLNELKETGATFWDKLSERQIPIVKEASRQLAEASMGLIQDPDNAHVYRSTVLFAKSIIMSESALAALEATERLKDAIQRALRKLLAVGISLL